MSFLPDEDLKALARSAQHAWMCGDKDAESRLRRLVSEFEAWEQCQDCGVLFDARDAKTHEQKSYCGWCVNQRVRSNNRSPMRVLKEHLVTAQRSGPATRLLLGAQWGGRAVIYSQDDLDRAVAHYVAAEREAIIAIVDDCCLAIPGDNFDIRCAITDAIRARGDKAVRDGDSPTTYPCDCPKNERCSRAGCKACCYCGTDANENAHADAAEAVNAAFAKMFDRRRAKPGGEP